MTVADSGPQSKSPVLMLLLSASLEIIPVYRKSSFINTKGKRGGGGERNKNYPLSSSDSISWPFLKDKNITMTVIGNSER